MYKPISDYAIIGNLRSAALVSKDGSIDWAAAPFIDSPSVFAALLDEQNGGYWSIEPSDEYTVQQYYVDKTNILCTKFTTKEGVAVVTDFIPLEKERTYVPAERDTTFKLHRKVTCKSGTVSFSSRFCPRFNYARGATKLEIRDGGVHAHNKEMHGVLSSHIPFSIEEDCAHANFSLHQEDSVFFVFRYNTGDVVFKNSEHHDTEIEETRQYWESWAEQCDLDRCRISGTWHDAVVRSLLVLKILFFEPVGTVAAAATTSLPEELGGVRNWDYRFTWLRDSSFIFNAFFKLGHVTEARKYINWLVGVCSTTLINENNSHLQIVYGLRGERDLREEILTHFEGYKGSKPVRIGNEAFNQRQWDVFGSILDMIWRFDELANDRDLVEKSWPMVQLIIEQAMTLWREPDEGLWEVRSGGAHFVYSKVMCSVAIERALRLAKKYALNADVGQWKQELEKIHTDVLAHGFSSKKQSFIQRYDSEDLDASLLLLPMFGFIDGKDPRMLSTIDAIMSELYVGGGLMLRYTSVDGLPGREGAFLLSSFWLVDALVLAGRTKEAREIFETVLSYGNHVGLFSEEIDIKKKEFLGNFPQAYTHVGLVNSAILLGEHGL